MHLLTVNYSFIPAQMRGMQRDSICRLWWSEQRWAGGYFPFQRGTQREVCPRFLPYIPSHWAWLGWIMQGFNPDVFAHTNIFFCLLSPFPTPKRWWEIGVKKIQNIYMWKLLFHDLWGRVTGNYWGEPQKCDQSVLQAGLKPTSPTRAPRLIMSEECVILHTALTEVVT